MAGIQSVVFPLVFLACVFSSGVLGYVCPPLSTCDAGQCEPPLDCPGGIVKEMCGCCDVCAKVLRETCGGLHGLSGQCDLGLTCVVTGHGQPLKGNEEGVCLSPELTCDSPKNYTSCNIIDEQCICEEITSCVEPLVQFKQMEDCYRAVTKKIVKGPEHMCDSPKTYVNCTIVGERCLCEELTSCSEPIIQFKHREDCYEAIAANILKEAQANCSGRIEECDSILPSCPADSVPKAGQVLAGECCPKQGTCICDPFTCVVPKCDPNYDRILKQKATGHPGQCCDIYECVYADTNCSAKTCPPNELDCPSDSFQLPSVQNVDECCSKPQGCKCLPISCPVPECAKGERLKIIHVGDNTPGRCCTKFHCIKPGEQTCLYGGEEYIEGATWKADNCTSCSCKHNVTFCTAEQCIFPVYCGRMQVPEGKCCPVCTGCVSSSGAIFANGETWQEDDCTSCQCLNGSPHCQAELCSVQCQNGQRIPGKCCPQCDGPTVIKAPSECTNMMDSCTKTCPTGFQKDSNGCDICECRLDDCTLNCEMGYATNEHGEPMCKCRCPSMDDCDKRCIHGFKSDSNGCELCRCAKCRSLSCAKKCPYGYIRNDRGCRTCRCLNKEIETTDAEYYNATTEAIETTRTTSSTEFPFIATCTTTGGLRDEGEMWHDGCRNCYCHAGKEMCGLITCPVPDCEQSIIFPGDCCPKCVADVTVLPSVNVTVCQSVDQTYRVEGETWNLDSCTHCICHNGLVLCNMDKCPPAACASPYYGDDKCCPVCPETKTPGTASKKPCVLESDATTYEDGSTWRVDMCHSCQCSDGQISCFSDKCPKLGCNTPVLLKNQCCPICLTAEKPNPVCIHDEIRYESGETWSVNECTECICLNGRTECKEFMCSVTCTNPLPKPPGQCCPQCTVSSHNYTNFGKHNNTERGDHGRGMSETSLGLIFGMIVITLIAIVGFIFVVRKRVSCYGHSNISNNGTTTADSKYSCLESKNNKNNLELNNRSCSDELCSNNNKAKDYP